MVPGTGGRWSGSFGRAKREGSAALEEEVGILRSARFRRNGFDGAVRLSETKRRCVRPVHGANAELTDDGIDQSRDEHLEIREVRRPFAEQGVGQIHAIRLPRADEEWRRLRNASVRFRSPR